MGTLEVTVRYNWPCIVLSTQINYIRLHTVNAISILEPAFSICGKKKLLLRETRPLGNEIESSRNTQTSSDTHRLRCLSTVFSGPYQTFSFGRLANFPDSNRCEIYTRYWNWLEV